MKTKKNEKEDDNSMILRAVKQIWWIIIDLEAKRKLKSGISQLKLKKWSNRYL